METKSVCVCVDWSVSMADIDSQGPPHILDLHSEVMRELELREDMVQRLRERFFQEEMKEEDHWEGVANNLWCEDGVVMESNRI